MTLRALFDPGIVRATRTALDAYLNEFVRRPDVVLVHPDDVDKRAEIHHARIFDLVVLRTPTVNRGTVRVAGIVDHGIGTSTPVPVGP